MPRREPVVVEGRAGCFFEDLEGDLCWEREGTNDSSKVSWDGWSSWLSEDCDWDMDSTLICRSSAEGAVEEGCSKGCFRAKLPVLWDRSVKELLFV
jgi:hypothetical protein